MQLAGELVDVSELTTKSQEKASKRKHHKQMRTLEIHALNICVWFCSKKKGDKPQQPLRHACDTGRSGCCNASTVASPPQGRDLGALVPSRWRGGGWLEQM